MTKTVDTVMGRRRQNHSQQFTFIFLLISFNNLKFIFIFYFLQLLYSNTREQLFFLQFKS